MTLTTGTIKGSIMHSTQFFEMALAEATAGMNEGGIPVSLPILPSLLRGRLSLD